MEATSSKLAGFSTVGRAKELRLHRHGVQNHGCVQVVWQQHVPCINALEVLDAK